MTRGNTSIELCVLLIALLYSWGLLILLTFAELSCMGEFAASVCAFGACACNDPTQVYKYQYQEVNEAVDQCWPNRNCQFKQHGQMQ